MDKMKFSVTDDRLCIDFEEENRSVCIRGKKEGGVFHINSENIETFPGLSTSDIDNIRKGIASINEIIID